MFVEKLRRENPLLIDAACRLHQEGKILPDSYVIDLEQFRKNAAVIKQEADRRGIRLYFMLKQLGRNPALARELTALGYAGAVAVDFKEAAALMRHRIPLGNVGHLVQTPRAMVKQIIEYGTEVYTVFSVVKAAEIGKIASSMGKKQKLLIRVFDEKDMVYSGQEAGIALSDLPAFVREISAVDGVEIAGVTSFPCFLYRKDLGDIVPTANFHTVRKAADLLRKCGIASVMLNTPSATSVRTLELMAASGGNCGEPGHGFTATTPAHAVMDLPEKICIAYVSEVSHNFAGNAFCYGGGIYRRGGAVNALVGPDPRRLRTAEVILPSLESIDYHFALNAPAVIGESVIMAFRYQVFVTRSDVVLLTGVSEGRPEIAGVWDSIGNQKC